MTDAIVYCSVSFAASFSIMDAMVTIWRIV